MAEPLVADGPGRAAHGDAVSGASSPRWATLRSGSIAIVDAGRTADDAAPLGYLHGLIGTAESSPFVAALAARGHHVVAPNLPGFAGSTPCADLRGIYDWVAVTSEVIDIAGLAGCHLVASSVGAMLALELAAVRPEAFASLTLIAPFGLWDDDEPTADPFATTLSEQRALLTVDPLNTAWFFDDRPGRSAADLVDDSVTRYATRTAGASLVWPLPEFGLATRIHRVRCPVTLVWGALDRLNPPGYLARYAAALPLVEATHVVAGAGHLAELDRPDEVAALVS